VELIADVADAKRKGSTTARGYGWAHQKLRNRWVPYVARGEVDCARCGQTIWPGEAWDLGHVDGDKSRYAGPEHRSCNRVAGAKQGAALTNAKKRKRRVVRFYFV